jgi:thiol:disulfide interchange protein
MKLAIATLILALACPATITAVTAAQELPPEAEQPAAQAVAQFDDFKVVNSTVGYAPSERFLKFINDAESETSEPGMFEGRGPIAILFLVFIGGLALNLTPCVLPMIPINLAIIGAGAQAGSRTRGFLLGGVYGGAMAAVYGALGLAVILTAGSFGSLNASPWFNAAIAAIFIVLGLAMFDVLLIDLSRFASSTRIGASGRGSFALAFGMGAIAALLAGACVAPVVLQVVLFSSDLYARGAAIALGLPFVLGLGMGLPWPIAGAGMAALPKPGAWMVRVKQGFGVLILATAVYYGYESYSIFRHSSNPPVVEGTDKDGWHHSLPEALAVAKAEKKQILIDMWATWCKNCTVMDETTFQDPVVKTAMSKYVLLKYQTEDPDMQPAKALMDRLRSVGLPTYAVLQPH